jgi:polyisoprenyl-phosphate glycosyltransferase
MSANVKISVVVPIYNEGMNIIPLYDRILKSLQQRDVSYEILYINDGSADESIAIIKQLSSDNSCVKYIDFSRNFGHQPAIFAGIEQSVGEHILIMDGDGQDPPEIIWDLYDKCAEGFDVVYAKRKKREGETWLKKYTAKMFYRFLRRITNIDIPVDTGDFRLISRRIANILVSLQEQNKFIRGQISWIGFNQTFIEYQREERMGGATKFSYKTMIRFALDGISGFSTWPLRIATIGGFFVSFLAFILIIFTIFQKYYGNTVPGWASTNIAILFIGGIQLIGIGILGEYLGRVSENVKNRPHYLIKETNIDS